MKQVNLVQGSQEWLAYRSNGIGGSDVASILNREEAYKSKNEVIQDKAGFYFGKIKEVNDFQKMIFEIGHQTESEVRNLLNQDGHNFQQTVIESESNSRFFASLDGLENTTMLEVKHTSNIEFFESIKSNAVFPNHFMDQIQWAFLCSNFKITKCLFVIVNNGETYAKIITPVKDYFTDMSIFDNFLNELDIAKNGKYLTNPLYDELVKLKLLQVQMSAQIEAVEEKIKEISSELLTEYSASSLQGKGIKIEQIERQGAIQYKNIPELKSIDLEQYRSKPTKYTKVSILK